MMADGSDSRDEAGAAIPLIDFYPFLHGNPLDRAQVAAAIDASLSTVGFIYLRNHGIDERKVSDCFDWSKRFFALSESQKNSIRLEPERSRYRGYVSLGHEKVRGHTCMKEAFSMGNPANAEQVNTWLSEELLPDFRKFMEDFFQDCAKLMHQLLDCLSLALNLSSADSLSRHHATSSFTFDLLHYPAISRRLLSLGDLTRVPAHSDTGTLTLLFQDSVGGLEVADPNSANTVASVEFEKNGTFKHVQPVPGAIVVNVGYLLMRWSNGRWKNTVHRVVAPPLHASGQEPVKFESTKLQGKDEVDAEDAMAPARFSIPFFSSPDPDTIVEALPGCWNDEVQKKWKPMHAGNYLRRKRDAAYS